MRLSHVVGQHLKPFGFQTVMCFAHNRQSRTRCFLVSNPPPGVANTQSRRLPRSGPAPKGAVCAVVGFAENNVGGAWSAKPKAIYCPKGAKPTRKSPKGTQRAYCTFRCWSGKILPTYTFRCCCTSLSESSSCVAPSDSEGQRSRLCA